MRSIRTALCMIIACAVPAVALAQVPIPGSEADSPSALPAALRSAVANTARRYPLVGAKVFGRDSVLLVFEDSTLTAEPLRAGTWMFGPPVTAVEADSCPPEKVLGRRIARALYRGLGRPADLQKVMVLVRGTKGIDRWSAMYMYYYQSELARRWAGDPES
jgi:hypothetical protein